MGNKIGITAAEAMARFREVGKAIMKEFTDFEDSINSMKLEGTVDKIDWTTVPKPDLSFIKVTIEEKSDMPKDKCEWKDGKFNPCDKFDPQSDRDGLDIECDSCGADIRKPEPTPIIRKSGGTWVARFEGVDYLRLKETVLEDGEEINEVYFHEYGKIDRPINKCWKPISEIEITDEIAKLRPMVVCDCGCNYSFILYGVAKADKNGNSYIGYENRKELYTAWTGVRLATVSDLEPESGTSKWSGTPHE